MAGERHGHGMGTVFYVWIGLNSDVFLFEAHVSCCKVGCPAAETATSLTRASAVKILKGILGSLWDLECQWCFCKLRPFFTLKFPGVLTNGFLRRAWHLTSYFHIYLHPRFKLILPDKIKHVRTYPQNLTIFSLSDVSDRSISQEQQWGWRILSVPFYILQSTRYHFE